MVPFARILHRYGRLRPPSRLSASLRPLARRCAALTAVLASQDNATIRAKGKRKQLCPATAKITRNGAYTKFRTLPLISSRCTRSSTAVAGWLSPDGERSLPFQPIAALLEWVNTPLPTLGSALSYPSPPAPLAIDPRLRLRCPSVHANRSD